MAEALTIKQPWAWAIIEAGKDVENKRKPTKPRGPLFVHAAKAEAREGRESLAKMGIWVPDYLPKGGIVGIVDVVDCVEDSDSPWAIPGYYHWVLEKPCPLTLKPMLRHQGTIFSVDL